MGMAAGIVSGIASAIVSGIAVGMAAATGVGSSLMMSVGVGALMCACGASRSGIVLDFAGTGDCLGGSRRGVGAAGTGREGIGAGASVLANKLRSGFLGLVMKILLKRDWISDLFLWSLDLLPVSCPQVC